MDTALVRVKKPLVGEILPPITHPKSASLCAPSEVWHFWNLKNITPVDNQKTDVVE